MSYNRYPIGKEARYAYWYLVDMIHRLIGADMMVTGLAVKKYLKKFTKNT